MRTSLDLIAQDEARTARARAETDRAIGSVVREKRATSSFTEPAEWLLQVFGTQSKSGAIVNENSALTIATFGACVNILASSMSNLPLRVVRKTAKGIEPAEDHPLNFLLSREPNATQTSFRWRSFEMACLCLGGNGYTRIRRNQFFEVEELVPMLPGRTQPRALQGGNYDGMIVYNYGGEKLLPQDVLHLRGLSTDGFFGISPIRALRESLGLALTMQEFTARTFNNGARKPGIFEGAATMTREKAQEFQQFWQQNYGGAQNAGKNPFLFGGVTWKDAGFSNDDAQLLLMKNFERSEIASWFRIPEILIGNTDKTSSWGTGIEQLTRGFVTFTLAPWATNLEQEFDFSLLTKAEKLAGYAIKFDFDELLRGSPAEQAKYLQTLWQLGAASANEIRRAFHMTEIADGPGNLRYVPLNYTVAGAPRPEGTPTPVPADGGADDGGTADS